MEGHPFEEPRVRAVFGGDLERHEQAPLSEVRPGADEATGGSKNDTDTLGVSSVYEDADGQAIQTYHETCAC